jgi:hypothetical protein
MPALFGAALRLAAFLGARFFAEAAIERRADFLAADLRDFLAALLRIFLAATLRDFLAAALRDFLAPDLRDFFAAFFVAFLAIEFLRSFASVRQASLCPLQPFIAHSRANP